MSGFRKPVYLDVETLVPLANYHDIEVMVDVEVSDRVLRSGTGGGTASIRVGGVGADANGSRASESETTQSRTIRDAPASALNRLVDELLRTDEVKTTVADAHGVSKRDLVELDSEWIISPATDAAGLMTALFEVVKNNPSLAQSSGGPPPEAMSAIFDSGSHSGPVILTEEDADDDGDAGRIIVLATREHLIEPGTSDVLEGDRTVFGIVESLVPAGKNFEFAKHLLTGVPRALRRQMNAVDLLRDVSEKMGNGVDAESLVVPGPVVLVRAIAVY